MTDHNRYLADMGYAAYERTLRLLGIWKDPAFDELDAPHQRAEIERAAAIRRRVVKWGLTAEEEVTPALEEISLPLALLDEQAGGAYVRDRQPDLPLVELFHGGCLGVSWKPPTQSP